MRTLVSLVQVKGQGIYAYVTLMAGNEYPGPETVKKELVALVRKVIGPIATPDVVHWAPGLPKTRSGKIMRRVLRKIASKEEDQLVSDGFAPGRGVMWRESGEHCGVIRPLGRTAEPRRCAMRLASYFALSAGGYVDLGGPVGRPAAHRAAR